MKINVPDGLRGMNLLDTPLWNKGTAFNDDERIAFALEGLLPPQVESIQEQSARAYEAYKAKTSDLERHSYLPAWSNCFLSFARLDSYHFAEST
jgi:malate dehydrogenase (oxaloacetate-decarboxylating)